MRPGQASPPKAILRGGQCLGCHCGAGGKENRQGEERRRAKEYGGDIKSPHLALSAPQPPALLDTVLGPAASGDQRDGHFLVPQECAGMCVSGERYLGPREGGDPAPSLARGFPSPVRADLPSGSLSWQRGDSQGAG